MIEPFQMIEITLTGTPRQRGQVHGEAVRPLIHELTGIKPGWNEPASYEPVKRRAAPGVPVALTTISLPA